MQWWKNSEIIIWTYRMLSLFSFVCILRLNCWQCNWNQHAIVLPRTSDIIDWAAQWKDVDTSGLHGLRLGARLCNIRFIGGEQQRRVSNSAPISVSDGNVHVWIIDVGADNYRGELSGLFALCMDLRWVEFCLPLSCWHIFKISSISFTPHQFEFRTGFLSLL